MSKPSDAALKAAQDIMRRLQEGPLSSYFVGVPFANIKDAERICHEEIDAAADEKYAGLVVEANVALACLVTPEAFDSDIVRKRLRDALKAIKGEE